MTNSTQWRAGLYAFLALSALAGEIWLSLEKMKMDGTQSLALFVIIPVIAIAAAVLLHTAVEDFLSFSWKMLRAPFAAALAAIGLCVALPASISSSGSARDAAVNQVEAANTVVDDAKAEAGRLKAKLVWAEKDRDAICVKKGPKSKACLSANDTVVSYSERRKVLLTGVAETPVKTAMPGEKRIAWAFSKLGIEISQDDILNGTSMSVPLALAFMGPFFGAMFLGELKRPTSLEKKKENSHFTPRTELVPSGSPDTPPRTRKKKEITQDAIDFRREFERRNGHSPTFSQLRSEFPGLPKASASRVIRKYA